jgi:peroxiredoxin
VKDLQESVDVSLIRYRGGTAKYQMIGFPTTYLIGKDGKIAKKYTGTVPDTEAQKEAELNRVIEKLLDGR